MSPSIDARVQLELGGRLARFHCVGASDRGSVRTLNEDSFRASFPIFLVADGMGGHAFGDRASQSAVAVFAKEFGENEPTTPERVLGAIHRANDAVQAITQDSDAVSGTTLAGVAFVAIGETGGGHWMVFNIGDSRVYNWDGRQLTQLSVDHSVVQELVDLGSITRQQAARHPDRNIVTRALGADVTVDPDIWLFPITASQAFLVCSDGLTKELNDDEIARIIVFHSSELLREPEESSITLAERLVNAAIAAGGSDNVTAIVVESELVGVTSGPAGDTVDRGAMPSFLEETRPRG